jgi:7-cyano-7-deazaguanine synthase in queuosine biosynthesis
MKVLLLSGGADSIYINETQDFDLYVYIDYGQKHIATELNIIKDKDFQICKTFNLGKDDTGFYECRNLKFILSIMDNFKDTTSITFGTNADDKHPDNNRAFFDLAEKIIYLSYKKEIKINTPLHKTTKKEIVKFLDHNKIKYYTD